MQGDTAGRWSCGLERERGDVRSKNEKRN